MSVLAHFTPAEIPGTLAILLLGLSMGALIVTRNAATRTMAIVACSLVAFGALGYSADVRGWPDGVRVAIDLLFLALAAALLALVLRQHRSLRPGSRPGA